jgi:PadR family transcriptional regulator PadR
LLYFVEMPKGDTLGEFEQIVMLAILRLHEEAYGMTVRREIEERTARECSIGAVYATLERLEQTRLVKSHEAEATEERGGRTRKMYELTAHGQQALKQTQKALASMMDGLRFAWK